MTKLKNYIVSITVPITATSPEVAAEMAEENFEDMLINDADIIYEVREGACETTLVTTDERGDFIIKEVL